MPTRYEQEQDQCIQDMASILKLAEDSKFLLCELSSLLNQHYRKRAPPHRIQRVLQRKNETISRLGNFIIQQQERLREQLDQECDETQEVIIERLEQQLHDQSAAFEEERTRLQQQATATWTAQADLESSLDRVLPQLRELLEAYDKDQRRYVDTTPTGTRRNLTVPNQCFDEELSRRLEELEIEFDEERTYLIEQVSEAAKTERDISKMNLIKREAALTCPISLDLFEDPVLTTCCGKTFSSEALTRALRQDHRCPVCREYRITTRANRDMANLVELHRTERSVLGLPVTTGTSSVSVIRGSLVVENESDSDQEFVNAAASETEHHAQGNESVQARADVSHLQTSSMNTNSGASMTRSSAPLQTGVVVRGRGRGGRNTSSRRHRSSRSSSSPTPTASSQAAHEGISRYSSASSFIASTTVPSIAQTSTIQRASNALARPAGVGNLAQVLRQSSPGLVSFSQRERVIASEPNDRLRYARAAMDAELNFHPYANIGYYDSDSDY
ncbi:unnamed protein product [Peronospora belbahrii]|uniref:SP-RING-type domain-containing protein n=1 Tax=Peronospora belbahrii TaxID=622444 RepID=A0AAU9L3C4_9STRA|nr:unnamed protein product [Peronospora belbahrii]CAH0518516.1 unnamed protein product [Peronospora belbahrii]